MKKKLLPLILVAVIVLSFIMVYSQTAQNPTRVKMVAYQSYGIITKNNAMELAAEINRQILSGWQPVGGVSVSTFGFSQAIVK